MGRVSSESKAGPDKLPLTVSYTYSGNTSNIAYSDYSKSTTVGIHGKPSSVTENGQIVEYEYTAAGNLELTRTNNLETTVEYDDRGFKKSQEDPSMGEWQYKHNAFGELVYQKDAKQQEVKMYYDLLGRMTRKVAPEGTSRWDYFASGNGIGQLEQETGTEATKIWTYDELGRVETETLNVNTQTFTTQFVHDDYSRLIETKYPNDVSMFNRYDNIGKLQNVSMKARDIKNIDFEYLLAEKDTLMVELERLQSLQQAALNKAQYHSNKALEYHKQYREFLDKFNEVSQSISVLNDIAVEHQNRAEQYIALYSELIEKANSIKTQFGSGHRYKMIDQDSENYYYARTYCASYHGWGPTKYCARYNTDQVTVAISDLTITLANGDEQIIPAPEIIDPVTFFEGLAQRYLAQSLVQQQVVGTVIGSETDSSIIEKTVSELDQGTLDLVYEFIDRDAQIQLYELKKVLQDYIYADNNYDECEFNIDDFSEYYFKNQEYNRAIANCESAYQVYRENLAPLLNDQELFRATISAYQTGAGASEFEISTVQLLLDYIKDVSFYEITSLLRRSMYPNPVNEDGSFNREGVNSIDCSKFPGHQMLDAELPIYSERVASLKTQLLARESFFTNAEVLEKIKQLSIARVEIELLSHIDELLSSSNYCYVWGWGAIDLEGDRAPWESYFEDDLPAALNLFQALQTELNSYSVEEPINETYVGFEERMRDEERLIPIMVGDIVTFVPATVEVPYIHQWEMEVGEAQDFYEEKYKYYFGQMEAAVSSSASEISELDNGIDSDLATIEARLGAVDEALYVIDEDGAAALAQSQQDLNSTHGKLTLWHAAKRTPKGYLQTEIFGNGLYTHRDLDPETGLVEQINTAIVNGSSLRQLTYSYDDRGRIIDKTDTNDLGNTTTETFLYTDDQGRLSDWTFDQSIYNQPQYSLTYSYEHDERGNITRKTNAGIMTYDPLTNQLDSRSFEGSNFSYAYDANGNMLTGDGRSYVWASFNKAQSVTANGQTVSFKYDASQKRVVKTTSGETRYYVQPGYEYVKKGSEVIHRYTVWADGDAVAVIEKTDTVLEDEIAQAKTADKVSYIHRDILGSGELITDSRMQVVSRRYYSPYGSLIDDLIQDQKDQINHLDQETAVVAESSDVGADVWGAFEQEGEGDDLISRYIAAETMTELSGVRGFTSHESIDEIGLINMNARLYDPVIGRFTSADSMIPDIETPLDYNRYSYVRGNPVVSRDPTGHYGHIIAAILLYAASHYGDNPTWQMASSIILSATMMNPDVGVLGGSKMTVGVAMTRSAVTNLTMSFLQSGKIGRKSLENAAIAAASAGVTNGIAEGGWINNPDGYWHIGGSWALITATHMVSQGVIADLRGDKFIHGAVSALASKIGSYATRGFGDPLSIERTVVVATFGGLASRATGGDFAQGAIQAAMVHLFNELTSEQNGCPGCVEVTFKNGNKGWVPQSVMNSGVIMADQADATSLESYTTTTQKEYATAFSVVGTLTIPYYLVSGASAMGALWLDSESVTNLIGVLLLPAAPIAKFLDDAFFYGGKGFQGTVDTAGYANDAIDFTNTLSIPEKTN
ncbi:hypothetical protein A3761_15865 [Oleiphilus sp. HI0123]|nr:hypothetical protein A3761_15865 [Oleiphilus sp. HI0123]